MKILCNTQSKKIIGITRATDFEIGQDEVQIETDYWPDINAERLNDTNDGLRVATQIELDTNADAEKDIQALAAASSPALEAAIEEFSAILTNAGVSIPADVKANITARIKGKLP